MTRTTLMTGLFTLLLFGCGKTKEYDGPTVAAFNGTLLADGKPVSFPADDQVFLKMFLSSTKPESFDVPIKSDGSFQIGWMPIGKYSLTLLHYKKTNGRSAGESRHSIPEPFEITEGQTQYTVDLGKNYVVSK